MYYSCNYACNTTQRYRPSFNSTHQTREEDQQQNVAVDVGPLNDGRGELVGYISPDGDGDAHEPPDEEHDGREGEMVTVPGEEEEGEDADNLGKPGEEDCRDGMAAVAIAVAIAVAGGRRLGCPDGSCCYRQEQRVHACHRIFLLYLSTLCDRIFLLYLSTFYDAKLSTVAVSYAIYSYLSYLCVRYSYVRCRHRHTNTF